LGGGAIEEKTSPPTKTLTVTEGDKAGGWCLGQRKGRSGEEMGRRSNKLEWSKERGGTTT